MKREYVKECSQKGCFNILSYAKKIKLIIKELKSYKKAYIKEDITKEEFINYLESLKNRLDFETDLVKKNSMELFIKFEVQYNAVIREIDHNIAQIRKDEIKYLENLKKKLSLLQQSTKLNRLNKIFIVG
jgi:acetone carboxylase gamma subunit